MPRFNVTTILIFPCMRSSRVITPFENTSRIQKSFLTRLSIIQDGGKTSPRLIQQRRGKILPHQDACAEASSSPTCSSSSQHGRRRLKSSRGSPANQAVGIVLNNAGYCWGMHERSRLTKTPIIEGKQCSVSMIVTCMFYNRAYMLNMWR